MTTVSENTPDLSDLTDCRTTPVSSLLLAFSAYFTLLQTMIANIQPVGRSFPVIVGD